MSREDIHVPPEAYLEEYRGYLIYSEERESGRVFRIVHDGEISVDAALDREAAHRWVDMEIARTMPALPVVNPRGNPRKQLYRERMRAAGDLGEALNSYFRTEPDPRDYLTAGEGAWERACATYRADRQALIEIVRRIERERHALSLPKVRQTGAIKWD